MRAAGGGVVRSARFAQNYVSKVVVVGADYRLEMDRVTTFTSGGASRLRRRVSLLLALVIFASLAPFSVPTAWAALAATASVDKLVHYRNDTTTFTFTVSNTSTAAESIGSVEVSAPSANETVQSCPSAPPGWTTRVVNDVTCQFNSAPGDADDIAAGSTSSAFKVRATATAGSTNVANLWRVKVDPDDAFGGPLNWRRRETVG